MNVSELYFPVVLFIVQEVVKFFESAGLKYHHSCGAF